MKALQLPLLVCVVIGFAISANAITNSIPYMNSFEDTTGPLAGGHLTGYTNGESIVNESLGWYATDTANGTVVTQALDYLGALPLSGVVTHDQVMELSDTVTNLVAGGAGSNVWIDCLLKPTRYDGEGPEGLTDAKTMLYFNTNGYPVVWGGYQDDLSSNVWHTSTSTQVASGQWARVTFAMNLAPDFLFQREYFKVYVDNTELKFPNGLATPAGSPALGPWLRTVEESGSNEDLKSMTVMGTGQMDDLQVVYDDPLTGLITYSITASVDNVSAATIDPSGTLSISESNDVPFTIGAKGGYTLTNVYVSYSWHTGWVGAVTSYTMTNVVSDGSITVYAEADSVTETSNQTPHSYYDGLAGLDTTGWNASDYQDEDDADNDNDGMDGFQEYLTGTDAADGTSYFRVLDIMYAGDSNKVSFFGSTAYGAPSMWSMYRSVNLTNDWDLINTNGIPVSDGTNNWWDMDAPGTAPVFYRPSAHVAP